MPNKRISELPYITTNEISGNTLIPLVTYYSAATGDTVHTTVDDFISFTTSATPITYSSLYTLYTNSGLTVGSWYEITDFETVYDQPNYFFNGSPKTIINTSGSSSDYGYQPIIVFATSESTLSPDAYQPSYPKDKIKYDITFNQTEINSGSTKGRIFERIDEYNNRTCFDHRTVKYIRYQDYDTPTLKTGTIDSFDSATGVLSGSSTLFNSEINVNDIIKIDTLSGLGYYLSVKVTGITSDTELQVLTDPNVSPFNFTGQTYTFSTVSANTFYNYYREFYLGQEIDGDYDFYTTFQFDFDIINFGYVTSINNYFGDLTLQPSTFLLPNNVIGGNSYNNKANTFFNNTFFEDFLGNNIVGTFYSNICSSSFQNNQFYSEFRGNIVGSSFRNNIFNNGVVNYDFLTATHVYNAYSTSIFENSATTLRLSYFDSLDNLVITDIIF
jgi:hypothetical protein